MGSSIGNKRTQKRVRERVRREEGLYVSRPLRVEWSFFLDLGCIFTRTAWTLAQQKPCRRAGTKCFPLYVNFTGEWIEPPMLHIQCARAVLSRSRGRGSCKITVLHFADVRGRFRGGRKVWSSCPQRANQRPRASRAPPARTTANRGAEDRFSRPAHW